MMTVWEVYSKLENISKSILGPIPIERLANEFSINRDILVEYLLALEILELVDFSDKDKVIVYS